MVRSARLRLSARVLDESPASLGGFTKAARPLSYDALHRWATEGVTSRVTGDVVKLEVVYRGGVLCTSEAAIKRLDLELNGFKPRKRKAKRNARVRTAAAG